MKNIYFDMDGTLADLYNSNNWLEKLVSHSPVFANLEPMVDTILLSKLISATKQNGCQYGVITWLPDNSTEKYDEESSEEKGSWLDIFFGTDTFEEVFYLKYGTPKHLCLCRPLTHNDILIDDNPEVLKHWKQAGGKAVNATKLMPFIGSLL